MGVGPGFIPGRPGPKGVRRMRIFYAWLIWWALHFVALAIYLTRTREEEAAT